MIIFKVLVSFLELVDVLGFLVELLIVLLDFFFKMLVFCCYLAKSSD